MERLSSQPYRLTDRPHCLLLSFFWDAISILHFLWITKQGKNITYDIFVIRNFSIDLIIVALSQSIGLWLSDQSVKFWLWVTISGGSRLFITISLDHTRTLSQLAGQPSGAPGTLISFIYHFQIQTFTNLSILRPGNFLAKLCIQLEISKE